MYQFCNNFLYLNKLINCLINWNKNSAKCLDYIPKKS